MSDTTNRIAGIAHLAIDGKSYMLAGDFAYAVADVSRETMSGQDRVHGYSEKPVPPHISFQLRDSGGLSLSDINAMTNVTISADLANGKKIIGRNMWTAEAQEAKTADATIEVRLEGLTGSVVELTK